MPLRSLLARKNEPDFNRAAAIPKAAGNNYLYIYTRAFRASALLQGEKIVSIGGLSVSRTFQMSHHGPRDR